MAWKDSGIDENNTGGEYEGEFWEPWDYEEDERTLEGTVIEDPKKGQYGKFFLKVRDSEGGIWITSQHAHLSRQISKLELKEQDIIRVEYLGQGEEPEDPTFSAPHLYKLQKWIDGE
jgi:hypothetical protein